MTLLWQLFVTFLLIGLVSFGGGYAMIPLIQEEVVNGHAWMSAAHFTDVIAVTSMSPGSIASNIAIFVGYDLAGLPGALAAAAGILLPSLLIIVAVGMFFGKIQHHQSIKSSFYGLRAVITGMIAYAAISFAGRNGMFDGLNWYTLSQIGIFLASLVAMIYFRKHPVSIILISGLVGIAIYN